MSLIADPGFSNGGPGWRPLNGGDAVVFGQQNDAEIARSGDGWFAYGRTRRPAGSVALDLDLTQVSQSLQIDSLTAVAWVRARPGRADVSGTMALWNLQQAATSHGARFVASQSWQFVSVMLPRGGKSRFRVEFYIETVDEDLLIDSVNVF